MQKNNNKTIWIIVGALVVIFAVVFFFKSKNNAVVDNSQNTTSGDTALEASEDVSQGSVNAPKDTSTTASLLSYADALAKYKDKRIQFNGECTAIPNTVTYKDNTGIMLDNRSAQTRTITVGNAYTVKPYGFKIITLPDIYLKSKTILVDCDKQQNVATILVQE